MSKDHELPFINTVDIMPRLNPAYWDGDTLGIGDVGSDMPSVVHPSWIPDNWFATASIRRYIQDEPISPLQTFMSGNTFDPSDFTPGTVMLLREERLSGARIQNGYMVQRLARQAPPERPIALPSNPSDISSVMFAKDGLRSYHSRALWGVVPRNNTAGYITIFEAWAVRPGFRGVTARGFGINMAAPITVGACEHRYSYNGETEVLRRINILQVIAHGIASKG